MKSTSKKSPRVHLEIQTHRANPYGLLRSSYREDGVVKHETLSRLTGLDLDTLRLIQAALQGNAVLKSDFKILSTKEYGASFALWQIARSTGLDKSIYDRTAEPWVQHVLALIVGRVLFAGSNLALSGANSHSALWELFTPEDEQIEVSLHCHDAMDRLLERQEAIQKKLAQNHLPTGRAILYDITSIFLGEENGSGRQTRVAGNGEMNRCPGETVMALICSQDGCPLAVEVFPGPPMADLALPGNDSALKGNDSALPGYDSAFQGKLLEIRKKYGIKDVLFVGDWGLVGKKPGEKSQGLEDHPLWTISALNHSRRKRRCGLENMRLCRVDQNNMVEVEHPDEGMRHGLCINGARAKAKGETRRRLQKETSKGLDGCVPAEGEAFAGQVVMNLGDALDHNQGAQGVNTRQGADVLPWSLAEAKLSDAEEFPGCCALYTNIPQGEMTSQEVLQYYGQGLQMRQALRSLKTVRLEMRTAQEKTGERTRGHSFLCMLSYYLQWTMTQRLQQNLEQAGEGKNPGYTLDHCMEMLKAIRKVRVSFSGIESNFITERDAEQEQIAQRLGVTF